MSVSEKTAIENMIRATEREMAELEASRAKVDKKYFRLIWQYDTAIGGWRVYLAKLLKGKDSLQLYLAAHELGQSAKVGQWWLDKAGAADREAYASHSKNWMELESEHQKCHGPAVWISYGCRDTENGPKYVRMTKVYNRGAYFVKIIRRLCDESRSDWAVL